MHLHITYHMSLGCSDGVSGGEVGKGCVRIQFEPPCKIMKGRIGRVEKGDECNRSWFLNQKNCSYYYLTTLQELSPYKYLTALQVIIEKAKIVLIVFLFIVECVAWPIILKIVQIRCSGENKCTILLLFHLLRCH
jgi:hypothetical protein